MANPLVVVDLSHHNPEPDWAKLKAGGVVGVILKATEGTTYVDKTFAPRRERALASGLKVGSYHFLKHGSAEAQMAHYLDTVGPERGERVCIDYEDTACTLDDLLAAVEALVRQPLNLQIAVYSGHLIKEHLGNRRDEFLAQFTSLWIAQYTNAGSPSWPTATWPVWSLWQFTDKATVQGISAPVDGNRFNGSAENAAAWIGPADAQPVPTSPVVKIDIVTPPDVAVEIRVNGSLL